MKTAHIKIPPDGAPGQSHFKFGQTDKVLVDFNKAIELSPKLNVYNSRGRVLEVRGKLDLAIADYNRQMKGALTARRPPLGILPRDGRRAVRYIAHGEK